MVLTCVYLCLLIFFIGCYSPAVVTKEELKAKAEGIDITLFTKDSVEYKFLKGNYHIQQDILIGYGVRGRNMDSDIVLDASLPLAEIASIEIMRFDVTKTIMFCGGVGLGAVFILKGIFHVGERPLVPPGY
jgi:hypothetical protein